MKVDDRKTVLDPRVGGTQTPAPGGQSPVSGGAPASADQVSVSDTARDLAKLRSAVGDPDVVREEKVATLREAVENGSYHPDVRETAKKLLRELLGYLSG
jgi:negative regulator of flagellin synthesis FlgM